MLFLVPLGYHTQTMIEYSLVKLMSSVNQNQDMMYVKKSITIGNVSYCLTCSLLYSMYSTYRKIVCMYIVIRYRPRFFDRVGHQTTLAYIENKHFFTK